MDAAAVWGIASVAGVVVGSLVTWLVARHYYLKAARERPDWANDLVQDVVARYSATHPLADPGDLVTAFETALKERGVTIDGGTF